MLADSNYISICKYGLSDAAIVQVRTVKILKISENIVAILPINANGGTCPAGIERQANSC
jgi:hypothetical protein